MLDLSNTRNRLTRWAILDTRIDREMARHQSAGGAQRSQWRLLLRTNVCREGTPRPEPAPDHGLNGVARHRRRWRPDRAVGQLAGDRRNRLDQADGVRVSG